MGAVFDAMHDLLINSPWVFLAIVLVICGCAIVFSYLSAISAKQQNVALRRRMIDLIHFRDQVVKLQLISELPVDERDRFLPIIEHSFNMADDECDHYFTLAFDKRNAERFSRVFLKGV
jgi:hypothetical protein